MKKGDIVKYKMAVKSEVIHYADSIKREIRRYNLVHKHTGIVLGYSFLKTGKIYKGKYYDELNYLKVEKVHKVLVIEPLECRNTWFHTDNKIIKTERYIEPVRCLESDIELIENNELS